MNLGWLQDKRMRFVVKTLPTVLGGILLFAGLVSLFGYAVTGLIALLGALFLWIVAAQFVEKVSPQSTANAPLPPPKTTTATKPNESKTTGTPHPVCDAGPYKVTAGEVRSIPLDVKQGQRVRGHLEEVDYQPFNWYIADEKNMTLAKNGDWDDFKSIDVGTDRNAYPVNRKIPYAARWYLIFDMYRKQNYRVIRVDFEPVQS